MTLLTPDLLPTKTYPFAALRYMLQQQGGGVQEGVIGATDFQVVQRAAGANMSVDVSAGGGWVQGDDTARQGLYHIVNDAVINAVVGAAHATLPRIDQIVARVYDSSVLGSSDVPAIEVIAGTATASAQASNPAGASYRAGAAALPNGAVRLADVTVPAAASSIVTANITDRRPWARGAAYNIDRTAGSDYTTTSGSLVDVDSTNVKPLIECSGGPLLVVWGASLASNSAASQSVNIATALDGVSQNQQFWNIPATSYFTPLTISQILNPAAGLHQIAPQWSTGAGTATLKITAGMKLNLSIIELPRQNAKNN